MKKFTFYLLLTTLLLNLSGCIIVKVHPNKQTVEPVATVIYLSRHAKKAKQPKKDPELTAAGQQQAVALANHLASVQLDAIYSTPYRRTMSTATPTASSKGIEIISEYVPAEQFAAKIINQHQGETILVVGHSNTVPALIEALGVKQKVTIQHQQYGDLFMVRLSPGQEARLSQTKYAN